MKQQQHTLTIATNGQGLYEFTREANAFVKTSGIAVGQLTLYCRHTSASLVIQENADPDVLRDLKEFFRRIVPEDSPWIVHRISHAKNQMLTVADVDYHLSTLFPPVRPRRPKLLFGGRGTDHRESFLGPVTRISVKVGEQILRVDQPSNTAAAFQPGSQVALDLSESRIMVVPG